MQQRTTNTVNIPAPRLSYLAIELTNHCNLKCSKCWSQNPHLYPARPKGYMTRELFYRILADLKANFPTRMMTVALSYAGESMLHPDFKEFSEAAGAMGFKELQLATNGTCLNKYANQVLLKNYTALAVSLHKQPGMQRVLQKAKHLYNMRAGSKPSIRFNIVAEEFSQRDLDELGVAMRGSCDSVKLITQISEDMRTAMPHPPTWPVCVSMFTYLAIMWDGGALPCCHILNPGGWSIGNVAETSLRKVFYGEQYKRLREGQTEGTLCDGCEVRR